MAYDDTIYCSDGFNFESFYRMPMDYGFIIRSLLNLQYLMPLKSHQTLHQCQDLYLSRF